MQKLPTTVQRLILAFTTGLFLACAAQVSAQGDTIPLSSIERRVQQQKSLMPEGLLQHLTAQEAADLLAYLESLK